MKQQLTRNQQIINNDINRYKTNSRASNLALLGLAFGCLYFLCVYGQNAGNRIKETFTDGTYLYTYIMGISVLLNLVFLLAVFLSSQELKNYNKKFSFVIWVIAIIQVVRIFIYPVQTFTKILTSTEEGLFETYSFVFMLLWLILSAGCLFASGFFGYVEAVKRERFAKEIEEGKVDLEAAYKDEEQPEEAAPVKAAAPVQDATSSELSEAIAEEETEGKTEEPAKAGGELDA